MPDDVSGTQGAWLSTAAGPERLQRAGAVLSQIERRPGPLPVGQLDAIVEALEAIDRETLAEWLQRRPATPASLYLQIHLLADRERDDLADRWEQLIARVPAPDAGLLLECARALARAERPAEAATRLRSALALRPPYVVHARAAQLVSDLWTRVPPAARRARVAILGATTTSLLTPVLRGLCFRDGVAAELYEGMFGAYRQEILDPSSGLHRFAPTLTIVATHWRDLGLPAVSADEDAEVERIVSELEALWRALAETTPCHVVQHAFDLPGDESHDYIAGAARGGRTRVIERVNLELARRAPSFVSVLDQASIQREVGNDAWQDERLWQTARQHPSTQALPALAELQMAHLRAAMGLSRKVVICDLDNTLWGGIIGEDGIDGIRIGPGSPAGEAHARLQEYLLELKQRGVLLAVCSKNDADEARLPFGRHPHMRLRLDDFAAFVANWDDKVTNVRSIAERLSLGIDSFVVLDDNPVERAWIRAELPDAAVVELGATPFSYVRDLDAGRYFFSFRVTDEDRHRAEQYQVRAAADDLRRHASSLDDFLGQLHMCGAAVPVSAGNLARVTQLVNKTNQFNLTTRRYQAAEIEAMLARPGTWGAAFTLADRFGDHGLISVVLCDRPTPGTWEIDTWVMSCRVLGRGMERFILEQIVQAARRAGIERLLGVYRPTARNGVVGGLFEELGFAEISSSPQERRYEYAVAEGGPLPPHHVTPIEDMQAASEP